jgi:hypothetical protein
MDRITATAPALAIWSNAELIGSILSNWAQLGRQPSAERLAEWRELDHDQLVVLWVTSYDLACAGPLVIEGASAIDMLAKLDANIAAEQMRDRERSLRR